MVFASIAEKHPLYGIPLTTMQY